MTRATAIRLIVILPAMAIGGYILLAAFGVLPHPARHPDDAPDWVGALVGFVFFGGASAACISVLYGAADRPDGQLPADAPPLARLLAATLGAAVALGLAALFIWVGFGPGERHFTGSGAFLGPYVGRAMFGGFGILTGIVIGWMAIRGIRRTLSRRNSVG